MQITLYAKTKTYTSCCTVGLNTLNTVIGVILWWVGVKLITWHGAPRTYPVMTSEKQLMVVDYITGFMIITASDQWPPTEIIMTNAALCVINSMPMIMHADPLLNGNKTKQIFKGYMSSPNNQLVAMPRAGFSFRRYLFYCANLSIRKQ